MEEYAIYRLNLRDLDEEGCRRLARIETRGDKEVGSRAAGPTGHPLRVISCIVSSIIIYYPISIISHIFS
jgi:hypothetical protein